MMENITGGMKVDRNELRVKLEFLFQTVITIWRRNNKATAIGELTMLCSMFVTAGARTLHKTRFRDVVIMSEGDELQSNHVARIVVSEMDALFHKLVRDAAQALPFPLRITREQLAIKNCCEELTEKIAGLYEGRSKFPETEAMSSPDFGRINTYTCEHGHQTTTIDRAPGVTPFIITCPACNKSGIQTMAESCLYKCDQSMKPTHEFYKPTEDDLRQRSEAVSSDQYLDDLEHVAKGGLLFREIKEVTNG